MGGPSNDKYQARGEYVTQHNVDVRIPDHVAEELGESPDAYRYQRDRLRSAQDVCFWALDGERATDYSKTGQPASVSWERIGIFESVDEKIVDHVRPASTDLDAEVGNDDIVDAFALARTASEKTGELQDLPESWPDDDPGDPSGLAIQMVYRRSRALPEVGVARPNPHANYYGVHG